LLRYANGVPNGCLVVGITQICLSESLYPLYKQ